MSLAALVATNWWMIIPLIVIGSVLHFVYDWTGHNRVAAVFSAVNESYWEHIKIAIWPTVLMHLVLWALGGHQYPAYIPAATVSLYAIPITMIGLIFLYKSITKRNVLALDIGVFGLVIVLAQMIFIALLQQLQADTVTVALSALYLVGLVVSFLLFTLRPPTEPDVFIDPITKRYGVAGHAGLQKP